MVNSNISIFDDAVPRRLQFSLTKSVLESYTQASRYCFRNFASSQAKDLSGHYCRAKIEDDLAGIAALFPRVRVDVHHYENNTGSYNEITSGIVKLTQSRILQRSDVPRRANFRTTLAVNGQLNFFDSGLEATAPQYLYAILTHVLDQKSERRSWPALVQIQFPNSTCTRYVDEGIDLLARFPDLASEYLPSAEALNQLRRRQMRALATA
jgi:hypothetical protein